MLRYLLIVKQLLASLLSCAKPVTRLVTMMLTMASGSRNFQPKPISWS